jgi:spore maturation protein CgeB
VKLVYFVHAIASCWNNGNAHFLRGIGTELQIRGHEAVFCEPQGGWSEDNLLRDHGPNALNGFARSFPALRRIKYDPEKADLDRLTDGADLVLVHEWNAPALVNALGDKRKRGASFVLLFHDTHHRALSDPDSMKGFDLGSYDGVLAFGGVLAEIYRRKGWANRVWTWHEAADTTLFYPRSSQSPDGDIIWVGNWGDEERTAELQEFLLDPVESLGLTANIFGVRYPPAALRALAARAISYRGWLANHAVPEIFARHRVTVHVPRRPYAETLRGIPTIRVFEALACGIPLVSAPWEDSENLFPLDCFLMASDGREMRRHLRAVLYDPALATRLRENGLRIIRERHSCSHRTRELLDIYDSIKQPALPARRTEAA